MPKKLLRNPTIALLIALLMASSLLLGGCSNPEIKSDIENLADGFAELLSDLLPSGGEPFDIDYASFIGGEFQDKVNSVVIGHDGNIYISGSTSSPDFPITNDAYDNSLDGETDAFFAIFSPDGQSLLYSTYFGGSSNECSSGCRLWLDYQGNVYIAGQTNSVDLPLSDFPNFKERPSDTEWDGFITKFDPTGQTLVFSTYIGGSGDEEILDVEVDEEGSIYLTGWTSSEYYPTIRTEYKSPESTVLLQAAGDARDAFITKLTPNGGEIVFSTRIGGIDMDYGYAITVDRNGSPIITGTTFSEDYPTSAAAFDVDFNSATTGYHGDVFVTKLTPDGKSILYSTFIGGGSGEHGSDLLVMENGEVAVVGYTESPFFPSTENAFEPIFSGTGELNSGDGFVLILSRDGSNLVFSTALGGQNDRDVVGRIIKATDSEIEVLGASESSDFPITDDAFDPSHNGGQDLVYAVVSIDGSELIYSTFFGSEGNETPAASTILDETHFLVVGQSNGQNHPVTENAFDPVFNGEIDATLMIIESSN